MVPSATRRPLLRQACAVRSTSMSTLSMGKCYPNAAAATAAAVAEHDRAAVAGGYLPHDGQAQPAARAGSAGHAVEALEHLLALARRDARAVVLDLGERAPVAPAGAHRDVPAAIGVLDGVVHQVGHRLAQQERVAL